jgi:peptidoglycan/LPS O-acetylase OafA/YrhL
LWICLRLTAESVTSPPSTQIAYVSSLFPFMHDFRAKHVPALDGLRGVAILLVITHHQLIPFSLSGGFLGVDLFFVLSGFLITTLLLTEFDATQTISLKKFYLRRALRLGPALLIYLAASLVVTYFLHPDELSKEFRLVALALAYVTNWRMAFGWDLSLDPTAIIWSLSIEEQFYLVWPILLLICLALGFKRHHLAIGLGVVIGAIMLHRYQLWAGGAELNRLYYGTDTRADAPLMGCLLAMIPVLSWTTTKRRVLNFSAVAAVCILAYLISTMEFTDIVLYQFAYTGIAALSGLLVWTAATQKSFLVNLFEWQPLRWFGKISYALYLWHWLLLKSTTFYFWVGETWDPWARFVAALLVSSVSFYFIERPFNRLKTRFAFDDTDRTTAWSPTNRPGLSWPELQPEQALKSRRNPTGVMIQPTEQNI